MSRPSIPATSIRTVLTVEIGDRKKTGKSIIVKQAGGRWVHFGGHEGFHRPQPHRK